ncbi:MAG: hypothetical protein ACOY5Y_06265 [Pseudomonadota bacterium]
MRLALVLALGTAMAAGVATAGHAAPSGDKAAPASKAWKAPKNAMGQPDLSGYWTNSTMTPFTRNRRLGDKATMSAEEADMIEKAWTEALAAANEPTDPNATHKDLTASPAQQKLLEFRPDFGAAGGDVGGYNSFWIDPGTQILEIDGEHRTSIVTTANGQAPPRKKDAPRPEGFGQFRDDYTSYETRSLGERCIMGFGRNAGPPMLPNGYYNNGYHIVQTPDSVVIEVEMIHEARVVRLNGQHRTDGLRPWLGDSIGRYEGDTLVVETTNIPERQHFYGSWKNLKVTEWFKRTGPDRIHYRFQVEDPDTWDQPWGGEYVFTPAGRIYEYACHEGNYALPGILGGARQQEKEQAAAAVAGKPGAE